MAQVYFYVPDPVAEKIEQLARAAGLATSLYLANLVQQTIEDQWPDGYLDAVIGGWNGEPLERPDQLNLQVRVAGIE